MRLIVGIVTMLIIALSLTMPAAAADEYWIEVSPVSTKNFSVEAEIETNIPGAILLTARLVYVPPKEQSGFVGTGFVRFPGINGKARVTIDGCRTAEPRGAKLPNGTYRLEVFYNYRWPDNTDTTIKTRINTNIKGVVNLRLAASDPSAANAVSGEEGLRWVVENVAEGIRWDPLFWRNKFGDLEEVDYRGAGDPKVHKMYYLKSIHVTLLIDDVNSTIIAYRMGLAHE